MAEKQSTSKISRGNTAGIFDQLVEGLEASIAFSRGKLSLQTTALPLPPPTPKPEDILALRQKYKMSQRLFAATLNVSPKTVQAWEQGIRVPNGVGARLLQVLEAEPAVLRLVLSSTTTGNSGSRDLDVKSLTKQKPVKQLGDPQ